VDGKSRVKNAEAREISALVANGGDDSPNGVIQVFGVNTRAADGFFHHHRGQFDWGNGV
jgi:hypothetical protein